jgi:hypothetical protein
MSDQVTSSSVVEADFALYSKSFYDSFSDISYQAAKTMLPEIYRLYPFESMCDFGCGSGTWLRAGAETIESPAKRLTGIDGEHARASAHCDGGNFIFTNLENPLPPLDKHDLAISLEVAEHLPERRAKSFVTDICNTADVVFFSAAVKGQDGANHINEQPQSYWVDIFGQLGYSAYDFHRKKFWNHPLFTVCPHYVGNSFLYIRNGHPLAAKLQGCQVKNDDLIDVVHPGFLSWRAQPAFKWHLQDLIPSLIRAIKRRS